MGNSYNHRFYFYHLNQLMNYDVYLSHGDGGDGAGDLCNCVMMNANNHLLTCTKANWSVAGDLT